MIISDKYATNMRCKYATFAFPTVTGKLRERKNVFCPFLTRSRAFPKMKYRNSLMFSIAYLRSRSFPPVPGWFPVMQNCITASRVPDRERNDRERGKAAQTLEKCVPVPGRSRNAPGTQFPLFFNRYCVPGNDPPIT